MRAFSFSALGVGRWAFDVFRFRNWNHIDSVFPKSQRDLNRFGQPCPVLFGDVDAILNNLHPGAKPRNLRCGIDAHDLTVNPDPEVALLLKKIKKLAWRRFMRDRNPKGDQRISPR